jgi:hypothetical protein
MEEVTLLRDTLRNSNTTASRTDSSIAIRRNRATAATRHSKVIHRSKATTLLRVAISSSPKGAKAAAVWALAA